MLRTQLGDIPLSDEMRRAARGAAAPSRDVILGVRPENFEDAALVPPTDQAHGITFTATIDVVESMGSDVFAYFTLEGGPAESAELEELAADSGGPTSAPTPTRSWPGSTPPPRSRRARRPTLWVDTRPIHIFDPSTGANLTCERRRHDASAAGAS